MKNYLFALVPAAMALTAATALSADNAAIERSFLTHTRVYLSSLVSDAESIAAVGPLDAEEIRSYGIDLISDMQGIQTMKDRQKFFKKFKSAYMKIFPEDGEEGVDSFRSDMTPLLAGLDDALSNLAGNNDETSLRADLADLQSRLQLVSEQQGLMEWLTRFDLFTAALLTLTVPTDREIITEDVAALLANLSSYLAKLENMEVETGVLPRETARLREKLEQPMSDAEFDELIAEVEDLLTKAPSL